MDIFCVVVLFYMVQFLYNLFEREIEENVFFYVKDKQIIMLLYGSLCRGLLIGKMIEEYLFEGDDLRNYDLKFQKFCFKEYFFVVK